MGPPAGMKRDFQALEQRRLKAGKCSRRDCRKPRSAFSSSRRPEFSTGPHVEVLRKLGWSCQRSTGRAKERDEKVIFD